MLIWRILGALAFIAGGIGVFVPLWPTTIFWILAAICFARSDPTWRDWIYARPGIGPDIERFAERGELSQNGKTGAFIGLVISALFLIWLLLDQPVKLAIVLAILTTVAAFIGTRRGPES